MVAILERVRNAFRQRTVEAALSYRAAVESVADETAVSPEAIVEALQETGRTVEQLEADAGQLRRRRAWRAEMDAEAPAGAIRKEADGLISSLVAERDEALQKLRDKFNAKIRVQEERQRECDRLQSAASQALDRLLATAPPEAREAYDRHRREKIAPLNQSVQVLTEHLRQLQANRRALVKNRDDAAETAHLHPRDPRFGEYAKNHQADLDGCEAKIADTERRLGEARKALASAEAEWDGLRAAMLDPWPQGAAALT